MEIQSLSITVPTKICINNCKFCCSKLHTNPYCPPSDVQEYDRMVCKCSALDLEELKHHDKYIGKRKKRGLFVTIYIYM